MIDEEFQKFCENLEQKVKDAYGGGTTMEEAEKLAGEFLHAQFVIAAKLREFDLNSRMRKSGLKAIKAAVYLNIASQSEKKPSDTFINAKVDVDEVVGSEQRSYDEAESDLLELNTYHNIFKEAHIFFRGIAKGSFNG